MNQSGVAMNKTISKGDDFTDLEYYRDVFDAYEVRERITVITVGILSVIANSLVLFAMLKTKKIRQNSASSFIFAILSVDLLFGYWFTYFFYFEVWSHSNVWSWSTNYAVLLVLIILQVAMSADRFWAILFPMNYMVRKESGYRKWVIIICISLGLMSGYYYGAHECIRDGGLLNCKFDTKFFLTYEKFFCTWAGIGFILLVFFNGSIVMAVLKRRKTNQSMIANKTTQTNFQKRYQEEITIATTMMMIILSFVICWLPFSFRCFCQAITQNRAIYEDFLKEKYGEHTGFYLGRILSSVSFSMTSLNSLIDPLVYAFRMRDIRTSILNLAQCKNADGEEHSRSSFITSLRSFATKSLSKERT